MKLIATDVEEKKRKKALYEKKRKKALEPYLVLVGESRKEKLIERCHLPSPAKEFCQLLADAENVILRCKAHDFFGEEESSEEGLDQGPVTPSSLQRHRSLSLHHVEDADTGSEPVTSILATAMRSNTSVLEPDDAWAKLLVPAPERWVEIAFIERAKGKAISTQRHFPATVSSFRRSADGSVLRADRELIQIVEQLIDPEDPDGLQLVREVAVGRFEWDKAARFENAEGGKGGTPLLQCLLVSSQESLLAARYILFRFPSLLTDAYGEGPYEGQNVLHLCVVKMERGLLLFIEKHVPNGLENLRKLANMRAWSTPPSGRGVAASAPGSFWRANSWTKSDVCFFEAGLSCYYGEYPLSFAAATGAPLWYFLYLVNRLGADLDARDDAKGNTALHLAVIHCKNEAYRYLKSLGADETVPNKDGLTPLQLAAQLGKRCLQQKVEENGAHSTKPESVDVPLDPEDSSYTTHPFMFQFILKLRQKMVWTYGDVARVQFPIHELHGHFSKNGTSALQLACQNSRYDLLCPKGAMDYICCTDPHELDNVYERTDDRSEAVTRLPSKPGRRAPPVESIVLLVIAHKMWTSFGRTFVLIDLACYSCFLGLITWVTVDRGLQSAGVAPTLAAAGALGNAIDCVLVAASVASILFQAAKLTAHPLRRTNVLDLLVYALRFLTSVDGLYLLINLATSSVTLVAGALRLAARSGGDFGFPADAELLGVACLLGYLYLFYYIRCFGPSIGPLAITFVQMLVHDVMRLLSLYVCTLCGFALALHVILGATGSCAETNQDGHCELIPQLSAANFNTVGKALRTTMMTHIGEYQTAAANSARNQGLVNAISVASVIIDNLLLVNLLIALLNNTYSDVLERSQQRQIKERTEVVMELERLIPKFIREKCFESFTEADAVESSSVARSGHPAVYLTIERVCNPKEDAEVLSAMTAPGGTDHKVIELVLMKGEMKLLPPHSPGARLLARGERSSQSATHIDLQMSKPLRSTQDGCPGYACPGCAQDCKVSLKPVQAKLDALRIRPEDTLLVVDMQVDFIVSDGAMTCAPSRAGADGAEVPGVECLLPLVNALVDEFASQKALVVYTQDYHPKDHESFASQHEGTVPNQLFKMEYGKQSLWKDHCVQGTKGCLLHGDLLLAEDGLVVQKGFRKSVDSFSAFVDNDKVSGTGLLQAINKWHRKRLQLQAGAGAGAVAGAAAVEGLEWSGEGGSQPRLFVVGLAYDVCVLHSAMEAAALANSTLDSWKTVWVKGGRDTGTIKKDDEKLCEKLRATVPIWREVLLLEDATRTIMDDDEELYGNVRAIAESSGVCVVSEGTLVDIPEHMLRRNRCRKAEAAPKEQRAAHFGSLPAEGLGRRTELRMGGPLADTSLPLRVSPSELRRGVSPRIKSLMPHAASDELRRWLPSAS